MATRFKANDLQAMIRSIVREEMVDVVKGAINEVLSERYLKQLAEASVRPRGVGPTLHIADGDDNDVEEAPTILSNPTRGIYNKHPMKHDDELDDDDENCEPELTTENVERNEMLSMFFQDTKPLNEVEARQDEGIPLERIIPEGAAFPQRKTTQGAKRPIAEVWRELAGVKKDVAPAANMEALEKREEMRLKMLRESLDRPVNG